MYFVGSDVGKRHHEAGIVDSQGQRHGKSLRFANSQALTSSSTDYEPWIRIWGP